jgi:hypothetical protein
MSDETEAILDDILSRQDCKICKGSGLLQSDEDCACKDNACSCISCKK